MCIPSINKLGIHIPIPNLPIHGGHETKLAIAITNVAFVDIEGVEEKQK